jgi:hypothetical protein
MFTGARSPTTIDPSLPALFGGGLSESAGRLNICWTVRYEKNNTARADSTNATDKMALSQPGSNGCLCNGVLLFKLHESSSLFHPRL